MYKHKEIAKSLYHLNMLWGIINTPSDNQFEKDWFFRKYKWRWKASLCFVVSEIPFTVNKVNEFTQSILDSFILLY